MAGNKILYCEYFCGLVSLLWEVTVKRNPSLTRGHSRPPLSGTQRQALNLQLLAVGVCPTYFCKWSCWNLQYPQRYDSTLLSTIFLPFKGKTFRSPSVVIVSLSHNLNTSAAKVVHEGYQIDLFSWLKEHQFVLNIRHDHRYYKASA